MSPSMVEEVTTTRNGSMSAEGTSKRSSADKRYSQDRSSRRSTDSTNLKTNGHDTSHNTKNNGSIWQNGIVGTVKEHLFHGVSQEDGTNEREEKRDSRRTSLANLSRPSTIVDSDQSENTDRKPHRLATRDDGYFTEISHEERSSFMGASTTHVVLDASMMEDGLTPTANVPEPSSRRFDAASSISERTMPALPRNSSTVSRSSMQESHNPHRISSPPAMQGASASNLAAPVPGKLQQRHTLEVPRPSNRASRETTRTADESYTSGRFSPIPQTPTRRRGSLSIARKVTRTGNSDLHIDEIPPDEDADRWTEMIRQKRASKRRRKEDEDDERVVMGTKVDQNHVNYVTAYNMLTGIRFTVSRTNAKLDRDLQEADFDAKHKFSFDITGNELTPSAKYDFKFKDYAPWVFRHLRNIFRIDPADYLMSLTSKYILSELGSPGKSGSFFYFSRDYKYIIKTIHHAEHKVLRKILRNYYTHVKDNPNTLLSQFYGLHRVKVPYGRKIHFVVMNNLFPPHRDIHQTFDLKGSTIGRNFKEEDLDKNPRATLKDLNWLRRNMHVELGPVKKYKFIEQMQKDVALLQKLKIMDYSLLVGIHDLSKGNEDKLRDKTLRVFQPGGEKTDQLAPTTTLMRTPSKLETQRKANELRQTLLNQKPVPVNQTLDKMPEEMSESQVKRDFYFYSDDRGFRATHEDDEPGEQIYYLGIIDCLTHYGFVKRLEHFWKGLNSTESQISAVPPDRYGDRFIRFISGNTKSKELAEQDAQQAESQPVDPLRHSSSLPTGIPAGHDHHHHHLPIHHHADRSASVPARVGSEADDRATNKVMQKAERQAELSIAKHGGSPEPSIPARNLATVSSPDEMSDHGNYTLPVVEESVDERSENERLQEERGSVEGRSMLERGSSRRSTASTEPAMPERPPPPTPPELEKAELERRLDGGVVRS
ncbi:SAICAR synthase-like protein [Microthyrium microscopicum]|uniref:1-phosphatidylinositol-4-phosphate 5-kinase n=1 Tax=Microthyrium microscopicum TaxID=703497 RepID=A0A6A6U5V0_9PEZI|nr:SAICAR synthase-like protein [Microthyrium microscopicum]